MDANILHSLSYGMYVVSSFKAASYNGQVANTVFQITSEPVTIAVSINKANLTHEFIESSLRFSVSILAEDTSLIFIGRFGFKSGRNEDKFKGLKFDILDSGCPALVDNAVAYLEAKVVNKLDCGTHTLFLGEVVQSRMIKAARPMTYDYYHQVKRGMTPVSAPTFIKPETGPPKEEPLLKYRCTVCNYIYDSLAGEPDSGVKPKTSFQDLPEDWVCPVCAASKNDFIAEKSSK